MAAPTDAQLQTFFTNVSQLRTLFQEVVISFKGNNAAPAVSLFWGLADVAPITTIQSATDGIDDLNALLAAAYAQYGAEGNIRSQLAAAQAQVASLQTQLASL